MGKNGLLGRLQRRLLLASRTPAGLHYRPPNSLPVSWRASSAAGTRGRRWARARQPAPFRLFGFSSIRSLKSFSLVLNHAVDRLAPDGRLVVISFHSLEDRIVKQFIASESGRSAARDPVSGHPVHAHAPRLRAVSRVLADAQEAGRNVRARSAVLRCAQRLADVSDTIHGSGT